MASHTVANAFRTMREDAPTTTKVLLAALHTQEATLLQWLSDEDDNMSEEWGAKYDLWQATQIAITELGGTVVFVLR